MTSELILAIPQEARFKRQSFKRESIMDSTQSRPGISQFVKAGFTAALSAAVLNNIYNLIYTVITGIDVSDVVNIASITMASFIPILLGTLIYFVLVRVTVKADIIFISGAAALTILSLMGPLSPTLPDGSATPTGFAALTIPMHFIAGLACILVLPRISRD